jgi:hypothetical protein
VEEVEPTPEQLSANERAWKKIGADIAATPPSVARPHKKKDSPAPYWAGEMCDLFPDPDDATPANPDPTDDFPAVDSPKS